VVELPWAADCCPCVEKLRTVLPLTARVRERAAHAAVSRRPPNPSNASVAEGYRFAKKVWALCIVQGPFSL
jgi:hypothetical protein